MAFRLVIASSIDVDALAEVALTVNEKHSVKHRSVG
jgi:hypothetical protein